MHGNSRQSLGGAHSVSYHLCGSGPAADGSNEIPLPSRERLCMSCWEREGNKKEKKKERISKKSSDTTGAISRLSLAHDSRLCHQPCPCSSVFLSALLKLPMSLAPWEEPCYGGRGEAQAALSLLAGLPTAVLSFAFWIRQLSVHPNCPNNSSNNSNNSNNKKSNNNNATAK